MSLTPLISLDPETPPMTPFRPATRHQPSRRRGATAVITALMLMGILGVTALAIDLGVLSLTRAHLQTAADAAALAGAKQLASDARIEGVKPLVVEFNAARTLGSSFALQNKVLSQTLVVSQNVSNTLSGDLCVGFIDTTKTLDPFVSTSTNDQRTNSFQVRLARDTSHGNPVPLFFARIFGKSTSNVATTSTATVYLHKISGYKTEGDLRGHLLPIVLDKVTADAMMAHQTTDQYIYNTTTKTVTQGSDGIEESKLYPVKNGNPGNWGTIKVGVSNNSTSILGDQIRNGITPGQMATFPGGKITLSPATTPPSITFEGNPGISAGIKDDLTSIIGRPVVVPVYDQTGGNGNNAWYRVIDFLPVRLLDVNFQGNPKYVIIQPALVYDSTAIAGGRITTWTDGGLVRLHLSR